MEKENGHTGACAWFIFRGRDILLKSELNDKYNVPTGEYPPLKPASGEHIHEFATSDEQPVRAFKVETDAIAPKGYAFVPLRSSFDHLSYGLYEMAGKMEELIYWDEQNRYCGICGSPMRYHTPISKCCTACGHEIWPQLQIAIIVLVKRGDEILMVQSKNFRGDYMGLVAGFVETGETLEQCVEREVMEETSIKISNIRYFRSQAWPYPCGLMVGFVADHADGELKIQESELNKGGWFGKSNLPAIPGKVSLARQLIDAWIAREI